MQPDLNDLMKKAQEMQKEMQKAQDALGKTVVIGESGGGLVKITMTGRHDVKRVVIDPSLFNEEQSVLEDLIAAAVNDAVRKVEATSRQKMVDLSSSIGLPENFEMPTSDADTDKD